MPTGSRPDPLPLPGCTVLPPLEPAGVGPGRAGTAGRPAPAGPAHGDGDRRRSPGGRFGVLNAFADCSLAGLTGAEVKVWLILFRDTKSDTGTARTGQADISRRAGLSERGVRKALRGLERKGLLAIRQRGRLNAGPSVYQVEATGPTLK